MEEQKEIRMQVSIFNNRLLAAREKKGLSQTAAAKAAGIHARELRQYESMLQSPVTDAGEWHDSALKLCVFYVEQPDYLWTDTVRSVRMSEGTILFGEEELSHLRDAQDPHTQLERAQMRAGTLSMLDGLGKRLKALLILRFGIGCDEHTLKELGRTCGLFEGPRSVESARQLEAHALHVLRQQAAHAETKCEQWVLREEYEIMRARGAAEARRQERQRQREKQREQQSAPNRCEAAPRAQKEEQKEEEKLVVRLREMKEHQRREQLKERSDRWPSRRAKAILLMQKTGLSYPRCLLAVLVEEKIKEGVPVTAFKRPAAQDPRRDGEPCTVQPEKMVNLAKYWRAQCLDFTPLKTSR